MERVVVKVHQLFVHAHWSKWSSLVLWCVVKRKLRCKWGLPNFIYKTISCAPLKSNDYEYDLHTVHQSLVSFTSVIILKDWLKATLRHRNGSISMKSLRNYFSGEGSATRKIPEAEQLLDSLYYNKEIPVSFELFLIQCQLDMLG